MQSPGDRARRGDAADFPHAFGPVSPDFVGNFDQYDIDLRHVLSPDDAEVA